MMAVTADIVAGLSHSNEAWTAELYEGVNKDTATLVGPLVSVIYTNEGGGEYEFSSTGEIPDGFVGWIKFTGNDPWTVIWSEIDPGLVPEVPPDEPLSRYTTYTLFLRRWGTKNVAEASQKDNKALAPDLLAVQDAFDFAVDEIDGELLGGVLKVPLDFTLWNGYIPKQLSDAANVLAFGYLYESRGWQEKQSVKNKILPLVQKVYFDLQRLRCGLRPLNAAPAVDSDGDQVSLEGASIRRPCWWRAVDGSFIWPENAALAFGF